MAQLKLDELCKRADLAIRLGSNDYTMAICQHILKFFPRHVQARTLLGQAFLEQGSLAKAAEQFKAVLDVDPENMLARSGLGVLHERSGELPAAIEQFERAYQINPNSPDVADGLKQLYGQRDGKQGDSDQGNDLKIPAAAVARWHSSKKQYTAAVKVFDDVLATQQGRIEVQLARAEALWRGGLLRDAERSCIQILQKAPNTLKAKLMLAEVMIRDRSREKQGLALLHEALGIDPGGRLAKDLFKDTGFLVPDLAEELDVTAPDGGIVAPAEVEAAISLLPKGVSIDAEDETTSIGELKLEEVVDLETPKGLAAPDILRIQEDLERIGNVLWQAQQPRVELPLQSGISTAELILTNKKKLVAKYGQESFDRLDAKLQDFSKFLGNSSIDAKIVYVDDDASLGQYNLKPVDPEKPEEIKGLVDRLEANLQQNGRGTGYVLIVGGDSIIPFFKLTNPVHDDDEIVLSDNPYGSRDADFLVPVRAVGRMPDAEDTDIGFIMAQLQMAMVHRHERGSTAQPLGCLALLLNLGISVKLPQLRSNGFGYCALVWKDAGAAVFQNIGNPLKLLTSPPITDEVFDINKLLGSNFSYFNLHGSKDSENWYGQKDSTYPDDYPMLPVALTPATVTRASVTSSVVYTEACYGANIIGRGPKKSIALRFLADGVLGFVGSTCTAYGGAAPPLSAADLLGVHFWQHLTDGLSLGQALTKAKATVMSEMADRQGYLDGDDQKTLLQFVLYGDPSSHLESLPDRKSSPLQLPDTTVSNNGARSRPHLVCRHPVSVRVDDEMPIDLIQKAVSHLHYCFPETHGASVKIHSSVSCNARCGNNCHANVQSGQSGSMKPFYNLTHFTSRKWIQTMDGKELQRIARATIDHTGEVVKTIISR